MAIHNLQQVVNVPETIYFNKINRTIRLLLNPAEDKLEQFMIRKEESIYFFDDYFKDNEIFFGNSPQSKFINLPVIPIYAMLTGFGGTYYI